MKRFISVLSALGLAGAALIAAPTVANAQSAYFGTIGVAAIADMWLGEIGSDDPQNTLPGGTYEGLSCTAWDNQPWHCVSLNLYPWFAGTSDEEGFNSLTQTGLSNRFTEEMDQEGTWSETARHCIALKQLTADDGHVASTEPMLVCAGPDGWTAERAVELGVTVEIGGETIAGQDGGWTVYNENNDGVLRTWFTVVNPPVEPEATEEVPVEEPTEETAQPVPPVNVAESSTPTLTPETATPVAREHLAATGADEFVPIGLAAAAILAAGAMLL